MKYKYLGNDEYSLKPVTDNTIKYATLKDLNDPFEAVSALRHEEDELTDYVENTLFKMKMKDLFSGKGDAMFKPVEELVRTNCPDPKLYEEYSNKTFEEVFPEDLRKQTLENMIKQKHSSVITSQGQKNQEQLNEIAGVLCLSNTCVSYLMWSHYANKHQGYCIGFNEGDGWFDPMNYLKELMGERFKKPPIDERYNKLIKVDYYPNRIEQPDEVTPENALDPFFHKSDVWEYEEEYRILHPLKCSEPSQDSGVASSRYPNLKLIELAGGLYLRKFPKNLIKEIVFGVRCSLETQKIIRDALAGEDISYFFAVPSSTEYEMIKEPAIFDFPYDPLDDDLIKKHKVQKLLEKLKRMISPNKKLTS